jgi:hypothetical protein
MNRIKYFLTVQTLIILIFMLSCKKSSTGTNSLYTPTSADVTANASLMDLQQGRTLYIEKCNSCHDLYSPDDYTPSQWKSILPNMTPRTNLTASEIQLVTKYVTRGN